MEYSVWANLWKIILQKDIALLGDASLPLVGLERPLAYFGLPGLPPSGIRPEPAAGLGSGEAGFEALAGQALIVLRHSLFSGSEPETVRKWAEKLMRFCEIRYSVLEKRAKKKWGDRRNAQLNMLQLAAFLLDYGIQNGDFRYVNTVLKLADLKWLLDPGTLARDLNKKGAGSLPALFQFRILLLAEYALARLEKGEAL